MISDLIVALFNAGLGGILTLFAVGLMGYWWVQDKFRESRQTAMIRCPHCGNRGNVSREFKYGANGGRQVILRCGDCGTPSRSYF